MRGPHTALLLSLALAGCGDILGKDLSEKVLGSAPGTGPVGRYTIIHSPYLQRDTVLLDTATGKTWAQVIYIDHEGEPVVWEPMTRADEQAEVINLAFEHPPKDKKSN